MERIIKIIGVAIIVGVIVFFVKGNSDLKTKLKISNKEIEDISKEFNRINAERSKLAEENTRQKIAVSDISADNEKLKARVGELENFIQAQSAAASAQEKKVILSSPEREEAERLRNQLRTIFSDEKK